MLDEVSFFDPANFASTDPKQSTLKSQGPPVAVLEPDLAAYFGGRDGLKKQVSGGDSKWASI
jgi:hypothetical protein